MESLGVTAGTTAFTTVTASATAHTKGSYASLGTASADWVMTKLFILGTSSATAKWLIDVRVGGATVIAQDIVWGPIRNYVGSYLMIPRGGSSSGALEVRAQCNETGSQTIQVAAELYTSSEYKLTPGSINESMGATTGTSSGVTINPGASANTKGAWAELSSSLTNNLDYLIMSVSGAADIIRAANANFLIDIGTGAASSEVVRVSNLAAYVSTDIDTFQPQVFHIPVDRTVFASGTRVSVRAQSTVTTDHTFEVGIQGYQVTSGGGGGSGLCKFAGFGGGLVG